MFDFIQALLLDILLSFVPDQRKYYAWYIVLSLILIFACSACPFIVEMVMVAKR